MLRFLSLAALSQLAIVLFQIVVFPLQIHVWGFAAVAAWATAQAVTAIIGAGDLGLRTVGFTALSQNETDRFDTVWTIVRGQIVLAFVGATAFASWRLAPQLSGWNVLFPLALGLSSLADTLLFARNAFLEAQNRINRAELGFLALAASRLIACAVAIGVFHTGLLATSLIWLFLGVATLLWQSMGVGAVAPLAGRWRVTGAREVYAEARWTVTAPLSVWAQLHLPVAALSFFAPAPVIAAFLAMRVIFGLVRAVVLQVGRVVSVRYARLAAEGQSPAGKAMALNLSVLTLWIAASVALGVYGERLFLTGPMFKLESSPVLHFLSLTFGLSAVLAVHQIFSLTLARSVKLSSAGAAQYAYLGVLGATAAAAIWLKSTPLLASGLVAADALLLLLSVAPFLWPASHEPKRPEAARFLLAVGAFIALPAAGWLALRYFPALAQRPESWPAFLAGLIVAGVAALLAGAAYLLFTGVSPLALLSLRPNGEGAQAAPAANKAEIA